MTSEDHSQRTRCPHCDETVAFTTDADEGSSTIIPGKSNYVCIGEDTLYFHTQEVDFGA